MELYHVWLFHSPLMCPIRQRQLGVIEQCHEVGLKIKPYDTVLRIYSHRTLHRTVFGNVELVHIQHWYNLGFGCSFLCIYP